MLNFLKLTNVGPTPAMEIHFKRRMNFLAGDNGLGKTFLLDIAWWVLTQTWAKAPAAPPRKGWKTPEGISRGPSMIGYGYEKGSGGVFKYESTFHRAEQYWPMKLGRPVVPGMVIYAQVDSGFSVWDPARNYWKDKEHNPGAAERTSAFLFKTEEIWNGLQEGQRRLCNGLIVDWAAWQRENSDAFGQLSRVLRALSPSRKEPLRPGKLMRIDLSDTREHPTLTTPYDQEVPIVLASAGIRRVVALAYLLVWTWQEHLRACEIRGAEPARELIFLIDEIEAHLHPQWQRRIVKALLDVMEALAGTDAVSVQLIATTHAPLVLASLEPDFQPDKDVVWELDLVEGRVELQQFPFTRLGDVNHWLTSSVFNLAEPRGVEAEEALVEALELLRRVPRPPVQEFEKVDQKLRWVLGDIDPFWIRWSHHLDQVRAKA